MSRPSPATFRELGESVTVLVVCPLVALMKTHLEQALSMGITATIIDKDVFSADVKAGKFELMFCSPDTIY